ncbi:MAG: hypothetical protein AB1656_25775 [Candidatus Omnitrophota bacterium]
MKKYLTIIVCLCAAGFAGAQEAKQVDITSFEGETEWAYSGGSIVESYVDTMPFFVHADVTAKDGEKALYVSYDNSGGVWQWAQLNFADGALDLTGMREIHMWVYFLPDSVGDLTIRCDIGGGSLGTQTVPAAGEWTELVWPIDRLTSDTRIASAGSIGGFIAPGSEGAYGEIYIDKIFAVRPAGIPEVETVLVYGFNEENPDTAAPMGWEKANAEYCLLGQGDVDPSEGSNYMEIPLAANYIQSFRTTNAKADFDRWGEVLEIMIDARVSAEYSGGWVQSDLIIQSGATDADGNAVTEGVDDWDGQGKEIGFSDNRNDWKTLLWSVDMSKHKAVFEYENSWLTISFTTNNDASQAGARVFYDNFRVSVPIIVNISNWSLY